MAKQRTPNLELITLNDSDTDSFYADYVESLGKIDQADQDRQDDLEDEVARAQAAEAALAGGSSTALEAAIATRVAAEQALEQSVSANATAISSEVTARTQGDQTNAAAIANEVAARQAMLVSGKLDPSLMPALAIGETFVVGTQTAMLALTAQRGDVAKRTDVNGGTPFMLQGDDASVLGNWVRLTGDYALASDLPGPASQSARGVVSYDESMPSSRSRAPWKSTSRASVVWGPAPGPAQLTQPPLTLRSPS